MSSAASVSASLRRRRSSNLTNIKVSPEAIGTTMHMATTVSADNTVGFLIKSEFGGVSSPPRHAIASVGQRRHRRAPTGQRGRDRKCRVRSSAPGGARGFRWDCNGDLGGNPPRQDTIGPDRTKPHGPAKITGRRNASRITTRRTPQLLQHTADFHPYQAWDICGMRSVPGPNTRGPNRHPGRFHRNGPNAAQQSPTQPPESNHQLLHHLIQSQTPDGSCCQIQSQSKTRFQPLLGFDPSRAYEDTLYIILSLILSEILKTATVN